MQRISFDYMSRRLKNIANATMVKLKSRKRELTPEEIEEQSKKRIHAQQFIPVPRPGPGIQPHVVAWDSRQVRRRKFRINAFGYITNKYPGENRKRRRSMAFDLVKNQIKKGL
jgi:hypothetical protein